MTEKRARSRWRAGLALFMLLLGAFAFIWHSNTKQTSPTPESLRIGYQNSPAMALIMVAEDCGFFKEPGVEIELKEFTAGKFALQAFFGGSLDVAVAGDVPIGLALLQDQKLRAVGEVLRDASNEVRMIVRQENGCDGITPQSYFAERRRKIATSFGGGPEYFTINFLKANNIPLSEVELISQKPEEMPVSLQTNSVDGISIFDPQAASAERALGPKQSCTFQDPRSYRQHYVIATTPALGDTNDPRVVTFIEGLRRAEEFIHNSPELAKKIVSRKTSVGLADVEQMWSNYDFGVTLDPGLIQLWREQAEWHRHKPGVGGQFAHPNYGSILTRAYIDR